MNIDLIRDLIQAAKERKIQSNQWQEDSPFDKIMEEGLNGKVNIKDIGGKVIKDNATYLSKDNAFGNNPILSSTFLRAYQHITGHSHSGQEEVPSLLRARVKC